jgi:hypothetical protein
MEIAIMLTNHGYGIWIYHYKFLPTAQYTIGLVSRSLDAINTLNNNKLVDKNRLLLETHTVLLF